MRKIAYPFIAAAVATVMLMPAMAAEISHPHLKAAHEAIEHALQSLHEARNGPAQFGDHRDRAEDLLRQAQMEIYEAEGFAKSHH